MDGGAPLGMAAGPLTLDVALASHNALLPALVPELLQLWFGIAMP